MQHKERTRPSRQAHGREHAEKRDDIVTDLRPFVAYYIGLVLLVAYGCACFARDMGWFA